MTHPAALDEPTLLAACEVRRQRRSGPGGQHRNKVETAVVITHTPSGAQGEASERRSQEENRRRALFRLRVHLALQIRHPCQLADYTPSAVWLSRRQGDKLAVNPAHADFPPILAEALDVLAACGWDAKPAAVHLGCSPSQLVKLLQQEPRALALVNQQRQAAGQPRYR